MELRQPDHPRPNPGVPSAGQRHLQKQPEGSGIRELLFGCQLELRVDGC